MSLYNRYLSSAVILSEVSDSRQIFEDYNRNQKKKFIKMTKASFAFLFVVCLVAVANVPAVTHATLTDSSHNLMVGSRVPGDYLLSQQIVSKSSKWLRIVTKDITFNTPNYQTITQVRALDQKTNGNGAYASITSGGPGNHNVTVHFKSIRGHSINFILEIYGR